MKISAETVKKATYRGERKAYGKTRDGRPRERWTRDIRWDEEIPGFGLRLYPTGRKVYVLSYRSKGRKKLFKIGTHGKITAAQARKKAKHDLGNVEYQGADPVEERRAERVRGVTVRELADRYLQWAEDHKKPLSVKYDRYNLKAHVLKRFGGRPVSEVERAEIWDLHTAMRSTPVAANRVLALLSKMFTLAERWGLRDNGNPVRGIDRYREKGRQRYLKGEELQALAAAFAEVEPEHPLPVAALRLLLFTGARKTEILSLRWSEVDFERKLLILGDSKTGAKTIYLGAPAVEVLASLPRGAPESWVLPGRDGYHLRNIYRTWRKVRKVSGLEDLNVHDLRHTHASYTAAGGYSLLMIGKLLGHKTQTTTQRYAHLAEDPVREAAERTAAEIASAMMPSSLAEVVPIDRGAG